MKSTRICTSAANFKCDYASNIKLDVHRIIKEYASWIKIEVNQGGKPYFCTFLFNPLGGSADQQRERMGKDVTGWYAKLAQRTVHHPRSPTQAALLPKAIFVPDLPVFKHNKERIDGITVNDGLHMHGIIIANRLGRISDPLNVHVDKNRDIYLAGKIRNIDVRPIMHNLAQVVDYAMKGLKRNAFSSDDILILPRTPSELLK